jgi:hypothetical protein
VAQQFARDYIGRGASEADGAGAPAKAAAHADDIPAGLDHV